jgi:hypothetical protein
MGFTAVLTWCAMLSASGHVLQNRDLTFEFNYTSSEVSVGPDSVGSFNGKLNNTSSSTITIAVVRRVNALPEGWTSSICLGGICYNESLDSVAIELNAGDSTDCGILAWTNGAGTGMIQLDLFDLNNINEHIFVDLNIYTGTAAGVGDERLAPEQIILYPSFPNPFNPVTTLRFDLRSDTFVNIIVYDIMGQTVKTLVNENHSAGLKSIRWNATDDNGSPVPAGIYFYTLQTSGLAANSGYRFFETRKMVLLK